jgi:2-polyprenyl-3-methyl-5-hydroxy-6-metoxy-1,4-benzoquinol methylase
MNQNINTYGKQASTLAASYNSLATPDILPDFAQHILGLPDKAASRVLDLGCGTGRDAFWVAQQGVAVVAADGAPEMLVQARKDHHHYLINYIEDAAPNLQNLNQLGIQYDTVLMGAFLFHFDAAERQELYSNMKSLLRDNSKLFITLRHGPVPEGRIMHSVPLQELDDLAKAHGGTSQFHGNKPDPLNRPGVSWDHVCLNLT